MGSYMTPRIYLLLVGSKYVTEIVYLPTATFEDVDMLQTYLNVL